jgi:hypothetical protein
MHARICLVALLLVNHTAFTQVSLNLHNPPASPEIFAGNIVSTSFSERDFALSPDGTEIFYTLQSAQGVFQTILYMKKDRGGKWTKPEVAPFAGKFTDLEPAFSADGKKLFFSSNRPLNGTETKDFDIWVVEKKNDKWGEAQNIGSPVNTSLDEFYPSVSKNGNLYFTAAYKNAVGREDIWLSKWENGKYSEAISLDTAVNSKLYEFNAFVAPDESFIIFTSYGRKDDMGRGDLYISLKNAAGEWLPAKNIALLNSDRLDYCPFVSPDKKILFFTSERNNLKKTYTDKAVTLDELTKSFTSPQNGSADIYWISFDKVLESIR